MVLRMLLASSWRACFSEAVRPEVLAAYGSRRIGA